MEATAIQSYFEERIHNQMGLSPDDYILELKYKDARFGYEVKEKMPFLQANKHGDIEIIPYTLDRELIDYFKEKDRKTWTEQGEQLEFYKIARLHPDRVKDGRKYHIPKGQGTYPFFPPYLLDLYEKKKK